MCVFQNRLLAVALVALGLPVFSLVGQEVQNQIEIVNQDGQPLNANQLQIQVQQQEDADPTTTGIQVDDGKIIIVNEDGTRREIDVTGAKSIQVNQSVRSIIKDGEEKKQVQGKAIIIGPDGAKQEILLGDGEGMMDLQGIEVEGLPEMFGKLKLDVQPFGPRKFRILHSSYSDYMIGIFCEPIDDGLRAQLDLPENIGLIVQSEPDVDAPAGKAGIMKHDILMYADQTELKTVKDLTDVIQDAGKNNTSISLTIVRRGKEIGIDVTPVQRPEREQNDLFVGPDADLNVFEFNEAGPGFVFGNEEALNEQFRKQFDEMQLQMKKHLEQMNQLQQQMDKFHNDRDDDR